MSTAYLFPGQGSQFVGMGRALAETYPAARALYDEADAKLGFSLSSLCFDGPEEALVATVRQQPAIFVTSMAAWTVLQTLDEWPAPDFVAGHSLGEITALTAAGSLAFGDALHLVQRRGELMQKAGEIAPGKMLAVLGMEPEAIEEVVAQVRQQLNRPLQLANDNCPGQLVLSGDSDAIAAAAESVKAAGARKAVVLPISIAAHSDLMRVVSDEFAAEVDALPVNQPRFPVVSNLTGEPLPSPRRIRYELQAQLFSPVRWTPSMRYLVGRGVETFVEVGPGDVLTRLMRRIQRSSNRRTFMPAP